jgi:hypothetical protein
MSWNADVNKPNGKSTQSYHCLHPWEAKHAIGVQHKKLREFGATAGIAAIGVSRPSWRKSNGPYENDPVKIIISGRPASVDETMRKISDWLRDCSVMHDDAFDRF